MTDKEIIDKILKIMDNLNSNTQELIKCLPELGRLKADGVLTKLKLGLLYDNTTELSLIIKTIINNLADSKL
jgi:hypothetical protein